ncbi:hypothetical protein DLAC_04730 [Tieghemostelium lacteum]|uniref:Uncharacterized protein n=1 Tax=Tieghemostelium lacteum TaxID=361077 RepID=A0A151ZKB0_TIELA|nr:hypothetical protein DLAC_04730 [Tieghemostelium lacteum]|eukprot:KYQ94432.1 hypothetical protein DLAC_04730 [Tieghemostelium lacteum]
MKNQIIQNQNSNNKRKSMSVKQTHSTGTLRFLGNHRKLSMMILCQPLPTKMIKHILQFYITSKCNFLNTMDLERFLMVNKVGSILKLVSKEFMKLFIEISIEFGCRPLIYNKDIEQRHFKYLSSGPGNASLIHKFILYEVSNDPYAKELIDSRYKINSVSVTKFIKQFFLEQGQPQFNQYPNLEKLEYRISQKEFDTFFKTINLEKNRGLKSFKLEYIGECLPMEILVSKVILHILKLQTLSITGPTSISNMCQLLERNSTLRKLKFKFINFDKKSADHIRFFRTCHHIENLVLDHVTNMESILENISYTSIKYLSIRGDTTMKTELTLDYKYLYDFILSNKKSQLESLSIGENISLQNCKFFSINKLFTTDKHNNIKSLSLIISDCQSSHVIMESMFLFKQLEIVKIEFHQSVEDSKTNSSFCTFVSTLPSTLTTIDLKQNGQKKPFVNDDLWKLFFNHLDSKLKNLVNLTLDGFQSIPDKLICSMIERNHPPLKFLTLRNRSADHQNEYTKAISTNRTLVLLDLYNNFTYKASPLDDSDKTQKAQYKENTFDLLLSILNNHNIRYLNFLYNAFPFQIEDSKFQQLLKLLSSFHQSIESLGIGLLESHQSKVTKSLLLNNQINQIIEPYQEWHYS